MIVPALLVSLFQICNVSGVYMTNASTVSLVSRMNIIFIVVLSYVLFESERGVTRSRYFIPANLLVIVGILGLVLGASEVELEFDLGVAVTILAAAFWAAYIVSLKKLVNELEPLAVMPFIQAFAAVVFLPLVLVAGDIARVSSVGLWTNVILIGSGILCVGAGNVANYVAIRHLGSTLASNIIAFKPLLTILFAYMILGEVLTMAQLASGVMLLVGCWTIVRKVAVKYGQ
jgi:drug/metabolite transporter (DMT)-like permease